MLTKTKGKPVKKWLIDSGICVSMGEARRLCHAGVVVQDGKKLDAEDIPVNPAMTPIKVGKNRIIGNDHIKPE